MRKPVIAIPDLITIPYIDHVRCAGTWISIKMASLFRAWSILAMVTLDKSKRRRASIQGANVAHGVEQSPDFQGFNPCRRDTFWVFLFNEFHGLNACWRDAFFFCVLI
jgi:hypothetical protein